MDREKGRLALRLLFGLFVAQELASLLLRGVCCCRGVSGELPDVSAEWLAELALLLPCAGRFGIRGGCRALWTRASLEAARALLSAISRNEVGKIAAAGG